MAAITKTLRDNVKRELEQALAQVGATCGVKFNLVEGAVLGDRFQTYLDVSIADGAAAVESEDMTNFKHYAKMRHPALAGLTEADLDVEFKLTGYRGNGTYRIAGFRPRAPKNNIAITTVGSGAEYVVPAAAVYRSIHRTSAKA